MKTKLLELYPLSDFEHMYDQSMMVQYRHSTIEQLR